MSDEFKNIADNLKAAEEILKNISIPGKKDSMLKAAKIKHVEDIGTLLKTILDDYDDIKYKDAIVDRFKEAYSKHVLKFIKGE